MAIKSSYMYFTMINNLTDDIDEDVILFEKGAFNYDMSSDIFRIF